MVQVREFLTAKPPISTPGLPVVQGRRWNGALQGFVLMAQAAISSWRSAGRAQPDGSTPLRNTSPFLRNVRPWWTGARLNQARLGGVGVVRLAKRAATRDPAIRSFGPGNAAPDGTTKSGPRSNWCPQRKQETSPRAWEWATNRGRGGSGVRGRLRVLLCGVLPFEVAATP